MIIGTHESIWWETIRHFPGDDIAACFDQEGQRTRKKAQLRWKQSCRNKDEPGEPGALFFSFFFFLPIYSQLACALSALEHL